MSNITDYPFLVLVISFVVLWLSTQLGAGVSRRGESWNKTRVKTSV